MDRHLTSYSWWTSCKIGKNSELGSLSREHRKSCIYSFRDTDLSKRADVQPLLWFSTSMWFIPEDRVGLIHECPQNGSSISYFYIFFTGYSWTLFIWIPVQSWRHSASIIWKGEHGLWHWESKGLNLGWMIWASCLIFRRSVFLVIKMAIITCLGTFIYIIDTQIISILTLTSYHIQKLTWNGW